MSSRVPLIAVVCLLNWLPLHAANNPNATVSVQCSGKKGAKVTRRWNFMNTGIHRAGRVRSDTLRIPDPYPLLEQPSLTGLSQWIVHPNCYKLVVAANVIDFGWTLEDGHHRLIERRKLVV